jgi:hypothetical protein
MRTSFFIYVDREGKMPFLSGERCHSVTHPYYIRYVNNRPVAYHGPADIHARDVSGTKIWDYSQNEFIPICTVPTE